MKHIQMTEKSPLIRFAFSFFCFNRTANSNEWNRGNVFWNGALNYPPETFPDLCPQSDRRFPLSLLILSCPPGNQIMQISTTQISIQLKAAFSNNFSFVLCWKSFATSEKIVKINDEIKHNEPFIRRWTWWGLSFEAALDDGGGEVEDCDFDLVI